MAYKVIILYRLYMPSYVLGTFTEYPEIDDFFNFIFLQRIYIVLNKLCCIEYCMKFLYNPICKKKILLCPSVLHS